MKSLTLLILLLLVAANPSDAQQSAKITVRLINGTNGKPIKDKKVNIWLGGAGISWSDTDSKGRITLDVTSVQPPEIAVLPNFVFDCRSEKDSASGRLVKYSLGEIISKGVVGINQCGAVAVSPTPSVLVLFARPRTSQEKREL
ncbi:MAG TPA: hypothetical protein VL523_16600 [Terriglobia bacterium]|nr:hypothetical protein [Terriglobia bacterium]